MKILNFNINLIIFKILKMTKMIKKNKKFINLKRIKLKILNNKSKNYL